MSGYSIEPVQQDVYAVLQPFIMSVTGLAQELVIQGLPNRSAMPPASPGFVMMQITRTPRLRTNIARWDMESNDPTTETIEQGTELILQIDCYGASAGDWSVMLSTLLRDDAGVVALTPTCAPLYTDDPILAPLDDSELQYEQRWMTISHLQYNPVTTAPLQTASSATV